jgi:hypothetical protein
MKKKTPVIYAVMAGIGCFLFAADVSMPSPAGSDTPVNTTADDGRLQARAEKERDPFLTDEEVRTFLLQDRNETWVDPNISAIFYSPRSSTIVVSGRVLGVNDFIDGRQIIAIRSEAVVLRDRKGTYVVKMGPVLQKQPSQAAAADQ